jgi:hypothetical protein
MMFKGHCDDQDLLGADFRDQSISEESKTNLESLGVKRIQTRKKMVSGNAVALRLVRRQVNQPTNEEART